MWACTVIWACARRCRCVCVCLYSEAKVRRQCCRSAAGEETCPRDCSSSEGRSSEGEPTGEEIQTGSRSKYGSRDAPLRYACRLWVPSAGCTVNSWGSGENPNPADPERRGWWQCRPWRGRCRRCMESEREDPVLPWRPRPPQNHFSYSSNTAGGWQRRHQGVSKKNKGLDVFLNILWFWLLYHSKIKLWYQNQNMNSDKQNSV